MGTTDQESHCGRGGQTEVPRPADGAAARESGIVTMGGSSEAQESSIDPANEVRGVKLILINASLCLCTLLVGLVSPRRALAPRWLVLTCSQDFTLIATATPYITSEFNSIQDVGWYGAAFQLAL